ncbi:MAG: S8 family peptidase [Bacteroidales bacterium]|nr:S8 family peptidase [Bacteroidales bacterium]
MKKIFLVISILFVFVNLSFTQNKSSYRIYNVNNVKKVLYNNVYYEVDTSIVTVKISDIKKIPFKIIRFNKLGYIDVELPANISFDSAMHVIETDNNISKVIYSVKGEYNIISPNDNLYYSQWGLRAINILRAWSISTGKSSVIVGVIDSGVDWMHPDLGMGNDGYHNFHTNLMDQWGQFGDPSSGNNIDDDNNGLIDDYLGWNYENNSNDCRSSYFHGTFVSGIISAKTNNNLGIAGIAGGNYSNGVKILPYCVGENNPISSVIDDAIIDAVDKGAKIIQLSLSVPQSVDIDDAIQYAYSNNAIVICAAGNNQPVVQYPASNPQVVAVGAIDSNLVRAYFSCYDDDNVDIVAPGVSIQSTDLNSTYTFSDGTSFAAPHISGVAALIYSVNPNLNGQQVREIIETTAQKLNGYIFQPASSDHPNGTWNNEVGYGLVDAYAAVVEACLYGNQITGDTNVQTCQISSFYYEGYLPDSFQIYWQITPNCAIYSGQNTTHVEIIPNSGNTAILTVSIILNGDTVKTYTKFLHITNYNTNIVMPNLNGNIPLDTVWTTEYTLISSIHIPAGHKLNIKADVYCMPNVKIIVENGGRLLINNAEISSYCDNLLWQGIEVWGSPDTSQYFGNRNVTSPLQGELVLNNAVIKNAVCGVRVGKFNLRNQNRGKGGGVVKASYSQFVNNKKAVHFNAYTRVNSHHQVIDNVCYFHHCTFRVDDDAYFTVDTSNVQVALHDVRGVQFKGCDFEDMQSKTNWKDMGTALYACNAGFRLNEKTDYFPIPAPNYDPIPYHDTACTFYNYKNAIAIVGSAEKPVKMYNTCFNNNSIGVNAKNADALSILSCSFSSGSASHNTDVLGLILDSCNLYRIENNQFSGIGNGIKIIGKTEDNNTIRLNTFSQLCRAIEVYGNNGTHPENIIVSPSPELKGLQFECNDFVMDSTDIYIADQATIKVYQGKINRACGNYFGERSKMHFNNLSGNYYYYYYNSNVSHQMPVLHNNLFITGTTPDICGNRHGHIGDSYYDMPISIWDCEDIYEANLQLYEIALDNYLTTYNGMAIDWSNIISLDDPSNPQVYDLIQLSELKNLLDETCIQAVHILNNATEPEITEISSWLQRLSSLDADLLSIHYITQGNDASQLQLAWDNLLQTWSYVPVEDTAEYQQCLNYLQAWARDTSSDINISQGAIDTLTAIANGNNTASPYAVSVLEGINEHYPWWKLRIHTSCIWTNPIGSFSPKKETDSEQMDGVSLQPNPTDGMMEIRSNNEKFKHIELFDIFGKRLMDSKVNDNTISLDLSHYAKGMYLLRYTLSDGTQQTKKIIKE